MAEKKPIGCWPVIIAGVVIIGICLLISHVNDEVQHVDWITRFFVGACIFGFLVLAVYVFSIRNK